MYPNTKGLSVLFVSFGLIINSCIDIGTGIDPTGGDFFPFAQNFVSDGKYLGGAIEAYRSLWEISGPRGYSKDTAYSALGQFTDSRNTTTDAGNVMFGTTKLSPLLNNYAYGETTPLEIEMGGQNYEFSATGGDHFPAFSETLSSPIEDTQVSFPKWSDTITTAIGVTVVWNPGNADTVYIKLSGQKANSDLHTVEFFTSNSGSYTILPEMLNGFRPGRLRLEVERHNFKTVLLSDNRWLFLSIHSDHTVNLHIQ